MRAMMVAAMELVEETVKRNITLRRMKDAGIPNPFLGIFQEANERETASLIFIGALRYHGVMTDAMIEQSLQEFRDHLAECECVEKHDVEPLLALMRKGFDAAQNGYLESMSKYGLKPELLPRLTMPQETVAAFMSPDAHRKARAAEPDESPKQRQGLH